MLVFLLLLILPPEGIPSQSDCVTKRQHPGKRLTAVVEEEEEEQPEKRQHPGRREEEEEQQEQKEGDPEDQVEDSEYEAVQKRQHPGRRRAVGLQGHGRQVNLPGSPPVMLLMSELSKRQHPGKRLLAFFSKRQHPGKRDVGDKGELEEEQEQEEEEEEQQEQGALQLQQQFDKRQHPGKRFWENSGPDSGSSSSSSRLCDGLETSSSSSGCSIRTSLLLDLLHHVAQEKRQHPGKRLAPSPEEEEEDLVENK